LKLTETFYNILESYATWQPSTIAKAR